MFYVYLLKNEDQEIYIGYTKNLKQRIFDHNHGKSFSTKGHQWKLISYEAYLSERDAREREYKLKYHGQAKRWLKERVKNSLKQN